MISANKPYLGFIIDEYGRSLYMDDSGPQPALKFQGTPKPLKHLPIGWMDTDVSYSRNMKYIGVDRGYSNQYTFVKDGAFILRKHMYEKGGVEAKLRFVFYRWNPDNGVHELFFSADIDLSQASDDPLQGVTVNLIEGGPVKLLKANESVPYEIPCNSSNSSCKLLTLDGVELNAKYNYGFGGKIGGFHGEGTIVIPIAFTGFEGDSVGIASGDPALEDIQEGSYNDGEVFAYLQQSSNYFFKTFNDVEINVAGTFKFTNDLMPLPLLDGLSFRLILITIKSDNTSQRWDLFFEDDIPEGATRTVNFNQDITLTPNEKVFLIAHMDAPGYDYFYDKIIIDRTDMAVTFNSRNPVSTTYCLTYYDLFKELIKKITGDRYQAESTLLQQHLNLMASPGDAIRGIDTAVIKTSLTEFADQSVMRQLNGGLCIDYASNTIRFESREYIFNNSNELMDLGEVSELQIDIAKELIYKQVNAGYQGKDSSDNLGKQNFNDKKVWGTPITRANNTLDLVCKYRMDIFTIEQLRFEYFNKAETATEKDNDIFVFDTMEDGDLIVPYRDESATITGGTNTASWYNYRYSPANILLRNGNQLSPCLWAEIGNSVTFQSSERNKSMVVTTGGVSIIEAADVLVDDLSDPLYYPYYFKFKTKVPYNLIELLQAGCGYIKFSYNGNVLYGFVMDLKQKPVYDEPQEWKLLCSSKVNLAALTLINDVLTINGKGMISHKLPLKFIPVDPVVSAQYNTRHMDAEWFKNRLARYSHKVPFVQKWQTNDNCPLQFISEGADMNDVVIYDCKGAIVDTVTPTNISHPAVTLPFKLWQVTIDWSLYDQYKEYYAYVSFGVGEGSKGFISEPVKLKSRWSNTLLIEYTHDKNQPDMIWKAPFETKIRVEGHIGKFEPQSEVTNYEDAIRDMETLNGQAYRKYTLYIEQCPDWLIDKINRILLLNTVKIDGTLYSIDKDARLEMKEIPGSPYAFWTIPIREKNNMEGIEIDASGVNDNEITVIYNINTKGFTSDKNPVVNQQDGILQIENIE